MRIQATRLGATALIAAVVALGTSSCVDNGSPEGTDRGDAPIIAFLIPDAQTARYEALDRPFLEARIAQKCPECQVLYANANQDPAQQQAQAESAIAQGVDVMLLDPVDSVAAATIVAAANNANVPVIAYDRFIENADLAYFISFDNERVGRLQGSALVYRMNEVGKPDGNILMIDGSPTDHNASLFKRGAHSVIDESDLTVLAEFDTPGWTPSAAQTWTAGQIVQFGDRIDGVYAANDSVAGGAIAAFKAAGISPLPPVTGQDADLTAIQRIISGDQYMTVYKAIRDEAEKAADVALAIIAGEEFEYSETVEGISSDLLTPEAVTIDTIMSTVVADNIYTIAQICTPDYAAACAAAGIG